jgi:hypothetical protein
MTNEAESLIIPDTDGIVTTKSDEGLVFPDKRESSDLVQLPPEFENMRVSQSSKDISIVSSDDNTHEDEIILPDQAEVDEYGTVPDQKLETLSYQDLINLRYDPIQFVYLKVTRSKDNKIDSDETRQDLLQLWQEGKWKELPETLQLTTLKTVLQEVGQVLLEILTHPNLVGFEPEIVESLLARYNIFLGECRVAYEHLGSESNSEHYLPELGSLTEGLTRVLVDHSDKKELVSQICSSLNQFELPTSQKKLILRSLRVQSQPAQNLRYRLILDFVNNEQGHDSEYFREQVEKRKKLLDKLDQMTAQECFENFDELWNMADDLVLAVDLEDQPPQGKVGVEIEYQRKKHTSWSRLEINHPTPGFKLGSDINDNLEMRKDFESLRFSWQYLRHLVNLPDFFEREATHLAGFHFHLDQNKHPNLPNILSLGEGRLLITYVTKPEYDTWELRGHLPPTEAMGSGLNATDLANLLTFYVVASREPYSFSAKEKIIIGDEQLANHYNTQHPWRQLIFGALATRLSSAESKLALLLSLKNDIAWSGINLMEVASSYSYQVEGGTKLGFIIHASKTQLFNQALLPKDIIDALENDRIKERPERTEALSFLSGHMTERRLDKMISLLERQCFSPNELELVWNWLKEEIAVIGHKQEYLARRLSISLRYQSFSTDQEYQWALALIRQVGGRAVLGNLLNAISHGLLDRLTETDELWQILKENMQPYLVTDFIYTLAGTHISNQKDQDSAWEIVDSHMNSQAAQAIANCITYGDFRGRELERAWELVRSSGNRKAINRLKQMGFGSFWWKTLKILKGH